VAAMINWNAFETPEDVLQEISKRLWDLDYRITGLTAVNLYGYGISTDVFDIAVPSDEAVIGACQALELEYDGDPDPYLYYSGEFYIRIQGDLMGEPFIHPLGLKLHSKELLIRRLEIYSKYCSRTLQACAWVALTKDDETALKYKEYWNQL
jgi:hypothetical protein